MRDKAKDDAEKAIRRQRAIESGFRLFSERGIERVTMPEIAEDSGVGRPTLYRYFSTKQDMVIEVSTWKWCEYIENYRASISQKQREEMTGAEHLRWFLDSFIDLYRNHCDLLRFNYYFNSYLRIEAPTLEQKKPYMNMLTQLHKDFRRLYAKGIQDGTIRTEISEKEMLSSTFHIMLAVATRYAVGLIFTPGGGEETEKELIMLKNALLREFVVE